jgi:hypothetical protein
MVSRKVLLWALCIALGAFCWNAVSAQERATLRVSTARGEHYARVWVVDAKPFVWIRAESPSRTWLDPLRENPDVQLTRGEHRAFLRATVWDGAEARADVDALFRAKYGVVDWVRSWLRTETSLPIRLEPRWDSN